MGARVCGTGTDLVLRTPSLPAPERATQSFISPENKSASPKGLSVPNPDPGPHLGRGPSPTSTPGLGEPRRSCFPPPALVTMCGSKAGQGPAHPSPGRRPGTLHSGPSPEAPRVLTAGGTLPQLPASSPKECSQGTFLSAKKKKSLKQAAPRVDRNKVMKFITARKQVLTGSHLPLSQVWNRKNLSGNGRGTVCALRTRGRSPRADGGCCP